MRWFVRSTVGAVLLLFLLSAAGKIRAAPLAVQFKNSSAMPDSQVYVSFVGPEALVATNKATGAALALNQFGSENWYTLDALAQGIDLTSFSGRIYVAYGAPWISTHAGYEPSPVASVDPNYLKRYDKLELTYRGHQADVANTTSIDYFSIPLELRVYQGGVSGALVGSQLAAPTDAMLESVRALTAPAEAAVVRDGAGEFVRVIGPSAYPPSPGLPASPYDNFDAYLAYLRDTYAPANGGVVARVKGQFHGTASTLSAATMAQAYDFTATIDAQKNVMLSGTGGVIGAHTLEFKYDDLANPAGIYGANPAFHLDGAAGAIYAGNDIFGWMIGDLLAGFNIGAVGSTVDVGGQQVGAMDSQQWFQLTDYFAALQPGGQFFNQWAAEMSQVSGAYNFAYTDRFAHVVVPLDPSRVDTLEITLLGDASTVPEPSTWAMLMAGAVVALAARRWLKGRR